MKRIVSVLCVLMLLFSFAACSDGDSSVGTDTASFASVGNSTEVSSSGGSVLSSDRSDAATDVPSTDKPSTEPSNEPPAPIAGKLMAITDQKNNEVIVVNLDAEDLTADSAVVWKWSVNTVGDVPSANLCNNRLDDVKLRDCAAWGGTVVGMTSSSGMVAVVKYPSGECLFSADMRGYGPHSIEILPNGLIAVAGSGNGKDEKAVIRIYRATSKTDGRYVELPLESAHGVVYDPTLDVLWGLGGKTLNAYKVGGSREEPTLTLFQETGLSFSGGHDLSPVYEDPDLLWISVSNKVYQYSKSKNKLSEKYQGSNAISQKGVKSINSYSDRVVVMTVADAKNGTAAHNTDKVRIFRYTQTATGISLYKYVDIAFDGSNGTVARDFYKVRAFVANYQ